MAQIQDWTEKELIYCIYSPVNEVSVLADLCGSIFDPLFNRFMEIFLYLCIFMESLWTAS